MIYNINLSVSVYNTSIHSGADLQQFAEKVRDAIKGFSDKGAPLEVFVEVDEYWGVLNVNGHNEN